MAERLGYQKSGCVLFNYQKYLGIQFKYRGTAVDEGFDCYNLCHAIYRERGVELPEYAYSDNPEDTVIHQLINEGRDLFQKIEKPEPYCLVLFSLKPPYATHLGVVLDDCQRFIHIMAKRSVTVERLDNIFWSRRIEGYYRYVR